MESSSRDVVTIGRYGHFPTLEAFQASGVVAVMVVILDKGRDRS